MQQKQLLINRLYKSKNNPATNKTVTKPEDTKLLFYVLSFLYSKLKRSPLRKKNSPSPSSPSSALRSRSMRTSRMSRVWRVSGPPAVTRFRWTRSASPSKTHFLRWRAGTQSSCHPPATTSSQDPRHRPSNPHPKVRSQRKTRKWQHFSKWCVKKNSPRNNSFTWFAKTPTTTTTCKWSPTPKSSKTTSSTITLSPARESPSSSTPNRLNSSRWRIGLTKLRLLIRFVNITFLSCSGSGNPSRSGWKLLFPKKPRRFLKYSRKKCSSPMPSTKKFFLTTKLCAPKSGISPLPAF